MQIVLVGKKLAKGGAGRGNIGLPRKHSSHVNHAIKKKRMQIFQLQIGSQVSCTALSPLVESELEIAGVGVCV